MPVNPRVAKYHKHIAAKCCNLVTKRYFRQAVKRRVYVLSISYKYS